MRSASECAAVFPDESGCARVWVCGCVCVCVCVC